MLNFLKSLFAAKPKMQPVTFRHAELGVLTLDSGLWCGETQRDGRSIRFVVGGTDATPDAGLLGQVSELVRRFPAVERSALNFLCAHDSRVSDNDFEFYSLDFLWEARPDLYVLEFTLADDIDGIWRVEFEGELPKSVGRDD